MSDTREFWLIFRLHLRMRFGLSSIKAMTRTSKGKAKLVGFSLLALYVVAALLFTYSLILYPMMKASAVAGMGSLVYGSVMFFAMFLVLILGTLSLLGIVFMAKDTMFYAGLPIRPRTVFAAKFSMVYLTELAASVFILIPASAVYSFLHPGLTLWFWCKTIVVTLLVPVVPLALSSILALPLMFLTVKSRHRDVITMVVSLVLLLAIVAGQMTLSTRMNSLYTNPSQAAELLANSESMLKVFAKLFPPAAWAAQSILSKGADAIGGFLLLLLSVMAGLSISVWLSSKLYYRGALAQAEALKGPGKRFSVKNVKTGSAQRAFMFKELKLLVRTPVYATNGLVGAVIFPIMLGVAVFGLGKSSSYGEMLNVLMSLSPHVACLALGGVLSFITLMNPAISTTFSREGRNLWMSQVVPVPVNIQVMGKLLAGELISFVGVIAGGIILILGLHLDLTTGAYILLIGLSSVLPATVAGMLPDTVHPKLRWNSEAEAMKQNMSSLLGMVAALASLLPAVGAAVLFTFLGLPLVLTVMTILAVNVLISFFLLAAENRAAEKMLKEVDG